MRTLPTLVNYKILVFDTFMYTEAPEDFFFKMYYRWQ